MSRYWFLINFGNLLPNYSDVELEKLWDSLSSEQLGFLGDATKAYYNAGYKAAEEDAM